MIHYDAKPWELKSALCGYTSQHGRMTTSSVKCVTCKDCINALNFIRNQERQHKMRMFGKYAVCFGNQMEPIAIFTSSEDVIQFCTGVGRMKNLCVIEIVEREYIIDQVVI
jgi:hypothetical protein